MNVDLTVRSFERNFLDLFWEFDASTYTMEYEWRIFRSEGPAGPWEIRTPWVREVFYFRDNVVPMLDRVRTVYYTITVRKLSDQTSQTFGPFSLAAKPDLIGMELIRQVRMELRYGSGRVCFLLPKRTTGPFCRTCYDSESKVRMNSNCISCYDTARAGGYYSPIRTEADIAEKDTSVVSKDQTVLNQVNTTARMTNFPPVKAGDVLITSENDRYVVERATTAEHRAAPYEQDVLLHLLPRTDIVYRIPVNIGDLTTYVDSLDDSIRTIPTTQRDDATDTYHKLLGHFGGVKL